MSRLHTELQRAFAQAGSEVTLLDRIDHNDSIVALIDRLSVPDLQVAVRILYEGYLLHFGHPTVVCTSNPDAALLAGDRLYALALTKLAAQGQADAIIRLSDLIGSCADVVSQNRADDCERLWQETLAEL